MNSTPFRMFVLGVLFGGLLGVGVLGCQNMQQNIKTAKDAVKLAQDACVIIRDLAPDNKEAMEVCAKEEELRPYIKLILGGRVRAHVQDDAGVASRPSSPATK